MFRKKDLQTFRTFHTLKNGNVAEPIGELVVEYEVTRYDNVLASNTAAAAISRPRQFLIHCTQKVSIWNPTSLSVSPTPGLVSYENYPALLNAFVLLDAPNQHFN